MDLREMANIAGKRLLSGTAISPAARNRTRLLAIPGRLSQCLRRAVRFWLTAAPARVGAAGRRSPCSGALGRCRGALPCATAHAPGWSVLVVVRIGFQVFISGRDTGEPRRQPPLC